MDQYSKAIEVGLNGKKQAVYYSNRAFCQIKLENFGIAILDAKKAIECDATFVKAYYRRGSAYFALQHFNDAVKDFKRVAKLQPQSKDARTKLQLAMKEKKNRDFMLAIEVEEEKIEIDIESIIVPESYTGPRLETIEDCTGEWVANLMQHFHDEKTLHKKYCVMIIEKMREHFSAEPSLVDVPIEDEVEFTVCGDTHGQYYDLLNIFKINGNPSETNPYLFNGDFVDRGSWSLEVMVILMAWKVAIPNGMHLTRGNHESKNMNKMYGFEGEVKKKYDVKTFELFSDFFQQLPVAYCLNKKVLVLHGGLYSKDGVTLDDIRKCHRKREPGDSGVMCESMWSDPIDTPGRQPSKRGVGI